MRVRQSSSRSPRQRTYPTSEKEPAGPRAVSGNRIDTRQRAWRSRVGILGGLLLDAAGKDERCAKVVSAMRRIERDNDREAFEGREPPAPVAASEDQASG